MPPPSVTGKTRRRSKSGDSTNQPPIKVRKVDETKATTAKAAEREQEVAEEKRAEAELVNDDIYTAADKGDNQTVKILIKRGVPIDKANDVDETPLYIASVRDRTETAKLLIESKAAIDKANKKGETPLHIASYFGNTNTARLLIEKGAAIDKANKRGRTPLYTASERGKTDTVELLIERKANVDQAEKHGDTPLIIASRNDHMPVVKLLVESGADITIRGRDNMTALDNANNVGWSIYDWRNQNNKAIRKFLEDHQRKHQIKMTLRRNLIPEPMSVIYEYAGLKKLAEN